MNAKVLDPQKLHPACEALLTPEEKQMWESKQKKPKKPKDPNALHIPADNKSIVSGGSSAIFPDTATVITTMKKFCVNTEACGLEIDQDKKFCNFCGHSQQPPDASAAKEILPVYPLKALRMPISELPHDVDPN